MTINIGNLLTRRANINANIEALYDVAAGRRFSYAELNAETNKVASLLVDAGVKKGDRVALLLMNSSEFMTAFFATAKLGAVIVPLNWRLIADELEFILKDSGTTVLVFGSEFAANVSELQSRGDRTDIKSWLYVGDSSTKPPFARDFIVESATMPATEPAVTASGDDLLYIMYTSGTTGLPKGVMHTHNTQMAALITLNATNDFCIGDRYLNPMPLFHVGALTPAIATAYRGLAHILMRAFDPNAIWTLVKEEKILLISQQGGEDTDVIRAIKQILKLCVQDEDFDVDKLTTFDLEYLFLKLRAKSVNNIVKLSYRDNEDDKVYDFELNLDTIEVEMPEGIDSTIKLSDNIAMIMKYPSSSITDKITQFDNEVDLMTFFIINCIDTIVTEEEIYPASEYTDKELEEFLDQLPVNSFEKIREFFEQMPKLYHKIEYTNELGNDRSIELTNLKDFFMWR